MVTEGINGSWCGGAERGGRSGEGLAGGRQEKQERSRAGWERGTDGDRGRGWARERERKREGKTRQEMREERASILAKGTAGGR